MSDSGGAYREFSDALRDELKTNAVSLSVNDADDKIGDSDLIIAVGMKAATVLTSSNKPILHVLVPKAGYDKLARFHVAHHTSAIYMDQPLERQFSFLLAALPKVKHIGVLYTTPSLELSNLKRLAAENNLQLHERSVGREHILSDALEEVLSESEALQVLPDTDIYNAGTIRNILLAAYRKQVPLIGISQLYVKAGALCAIYSTSKQIAVQTAEAVKQFASSGKLPPSQYPKEFEVSVNMQVARSLDIPIKDAEQLHNEVRRAP